MQTSRRFTHLLISVVVLLLATSVANAGDPPDPAREPFVAGSAEDYYLRALELLGERRYADAEAPLREAVRLDPKSPQYMSQLGIVLQMLGKDEEARQAFDKARELGTAEPEEEGGIDEVEADKGADELLRGDEALERGKPAEAEAAYRAAVAANPQNATHHAALADALQEQGKWVEAEAARVQAVRLEPDNAERHFELGWTFEAQKKWSEAAPSFQKACELEPNNGHYMLALAGVLHEMGRQREAAEAEAKALALLGEEHDFPEDAGMPEFDPADDTERSVTISGDGSSDPGPGGKSWYGATIVTISADLAMAFGRSAPGGAYVIAVEPKSQAAAAGLRTNDAIVEANGNPVRDANQLYKLDASDTVIRIAVERGGERVALALSPG